MTQASTVLRVVGVETAGYQLTSVERVMVRVCGPCAAGYGVSVCRFCADAGGILLENSSAESCAVGVGVAALLEGSAPLV